MMGLRGILIWSFTVLLLAFNLIGVPIHLDKSKRGQLAGHRILYVYNAENSGLRSSSTFALFEDRAKRFWISIFGSIMLFDEKQSRWTAFSFDTGDPVENMVTMIAQSADGKLWFAGRPVSSNAAASIGCYDGNKLTKIEVANSPLEVYKDRFDMGTIYTMFQGQHGKVWFSVRDGLVSFNGQEWVRQLGLSTKIKDSRPVLINVGIQDSDGYMWTGGGSAGIIKFDEKKSEWKTYDPVTMNLNRNVKLTNDGSVDDSGAKGITTVLEDRRKRIWFAVTDGHVYLYSKSEDSWKSYNVPDHVPFLSEELPIGPYLHIRAIYQDKAGQMMFATSKGLLILDERRNKWELITTENGDLPGASITTIMEDSRGRIWIGTTKGIVVLDQ